MTAIVVMVENSLKKLPTNFLNRKGHRIVKVASIDEFTSHKIKHDKHLIRQSSASYWL